MPKDEPHGAKLSVPRDVRTLLMPHCMHKGWEVDLAPKKLFYVRGLTKFRTEFGLEVTLLTPHIEGMRKMLKGLGSWGISSLKWKEEFSPRQVYAAYDKGALSLDKAGQIILLCAYAAEQRFLTTKTGIRGNDVFNMLIIEPKVYFVNGFNEKAFKQLEDGSDHLEKLRLYSGQRTLQVFSEAATKFSRHRVTFKLACAIKVYVEAHTKIKLGDIDSDDKGAPKPNAYETVEFDIPAEVQALMDKLTKK